MAKITQTRLAKICGVSQTAISQAIKRGDLPKKLDDENIHVKNYIESKTGSEKNELDDLLDQTKIAKAVENRAKAELMELRVAEAKGDMLSRAAVEFLFFGYLERLNREVLLISKVARSQIETAVKSGDVEEVVKILQRETEAILRRVKSDQKTEFEKWQREA